MNQTKNFSSEMVEKQVMVIFCLLSQSSERWKKKWRRFFDFFKKVKSAKICTTPLKGGRFLSIVKFQETDL